MTKAVKTFERGSMINRAYDNWSPSVFYGEESYHLSIQTIVQFGLVKFRD